MKENAASISALKYVPRSAPVHVPRSSPAPKPEKQVVSTPAPSPVAETPAFSSNASDSNSVQELEGIVNFSISFWLLTAAIQSLSFLLSLFCLLFFRYVCSLCVFCLCSETSIFTKFKTLWLAVTKF
jgi:hypothetical protein